MSKVTKDDAKDLALKFSGWQSALVEYRRKPTKLNLAGLKTWAKGLAKAQIETGVEIVSQQTLAQHCGKVFTAITGETIVLEKA